MGKFIEKFWKIHGKTCWEVLEYWRKIRVCYFVNFLYGLLFRHVLVRHSEEVKILTLENNGKHVSMRMFNGKLWKIQRKTQWKIHEDAKKN